MASIGIRVFHGSGVGLMAALLVAACSSSSSGGGDSCSPMGGPVTGKADDHCAGKPPQATDLASCDVTLDAGSSDDAGILDPGDGGPTGDCDPGAFGASMYGTEGDDDDCKYHVRWTSTPICENGSGTTFTVTATKLADGTPLTGAAPYIEAVQACSHPIPNVPNRAVEHPAGTYTIGPVIFDRPGRWVVRFHFYGNCEDALETSPHGHAAFFVSVP